MPATPIRWIFFDLGSVLFNDDQQALKAYLHVHRHLQANDPGYTFEAMLKEREHLIGEQTGWVLHHMVREKLGEERMDPVFAELRQQLHRDFDQNHLLNPGAEKMLWSLTQQYRLGIIANQPPEARASLDRRGLLDLFEVIAISEEVDLFKPDPELYRWAIREAGCDPDEAAMVGDRIDNDIAPAQELGMRGVLIDVPQPERPWQPQTDREKAFRASCQQVPLYDTKAIREATRPTAEIERLADLPATLTKLQTDA